MPYVFAGHYVEALLAQSGATVQILAATSVIVRLPDGATAATLYTDRTKAVVAANPAVTDARGNLSIFTPPGEYLGYPVIGGVEQASFKIVVPVDPLDAIQDVSQQIAPPLNPIVGDLWIDTDAAVSGVSVGSSGTAALVGGVITVALPAVTAASRIFLTSQADGGTVGFLRVSARTAGTSFTITSSSGSDTSTVAWQIVKP